MVDLDRRKAIALLAGGVGVGAVALLVRSPADAKVDSPYVLYGADKTDNNFIPKGKSLDAYDRDIKVVDDNANLILQRGAFTGGLPGQVVEYDSTFSGDVNLFGVKHKDTGQGFPVLGVYEVGDGTNTSFLLVGSRTPNMNFGLNQVVTLELLLAGSGAQVGLPTGVGGGTSSDFGTYAAPVHAGHRHAFSGRFSLGSYLYDAARGGVLPVTFGRIQFANAVTLRSIEVQVLVAPGVAGNDNYRVWDGVGGLNVNLGVGAVNARATGTRNVAANTAILFQLNGRATVPATDVNVLVEYTMNV